MPTLSSWRKAQTRRLHTPRDAQLPLLSMYQHYFQVPSQHALLRVQPTTAGRPSRFHPGPVGRWEADISAPLELWRVVLIVKGETVLLRHVPSILQLLSRARAKGLISINPINPGIGSWLSARHSLFDISLGPDARTDLCSSQCV